MPSTTGSDQLLKKFRTSFNGGVNYYAGIRQVKDNQSPQSVNCDFKGQSGVGNRQGYTQVGSVISSRTSLYGMAEYHTAALDYAVKFASDGIDTRLGYGTGGSWTFDGSFAFTTGVNIDSVQANGLLYTFNGVDAMQQWDGTNVNPTSSGKILKYGAYYDKRGWGVDPAALDTLYFSKQSTFDFSDTGSGSVTIFPGSGAKIVGMKVFRDNLYVFLNGAVRGIFRIAPASAANTFSVTMVTNTIGCVSHRSIAQIENDLYFCADDGVYSLGEVATFVSIRTTNKSLVVQNVLTSLSGSSKQKLVGRYFNFKYHLFYSLFGGNNDSCLAYDIRYQGWQDWRNIAAQDATTYTDATNTTHLYFGEPSTGKVHEMYIGSTDAGTIIPSTWYSKSYDEDLADTEKLYFDSTFIFGQLGGTVNVAVIFNDSQVSVTKTLTQQNPQGGFGFAAFGRSAFGTNSNMITVTQAVNQPERIRAKGQKFAVQYLISSTSSWRLDTITQTYQVFSHYKFPSNLKLN